MAVVLIEGQVDWRVEQDSEGHREYVVTHKVLADRADGPYDVLNCGGLPEDHAFFEQSGRDRRTSWSYVSYRPLFDTPGRAR